MKNLPIDLKNDYLLKETTLAQTFKLTLRNGEVFGFTSFNEDVVFAEEPTVIYKAFSGMTPSAITSSAAFNVDNLDVEGFLEDDRITESDLKQGKYDYAKVLICEFNWKNKPYSLAKVSKERKGLLGEVKIIGGKFVAEIRGLQQNLQNKINELYQTPCSADLGDSKCKVNLTSFKESGVVGSVTNNITIYATLTQLAGYYDLGKITFTSGLNNGLSYEVKTWNGLAVELELPANYKIEPTDTFEIVVGCNKTIKTCQDVFLNSTNFRGFPYIPITSQIVNS